MSDSNPDTAVPALKLFGLREGKYSYRGLLWFAGVYLGAFLLAGLLAPPLYALVGWLAERGGEESLWAYLHSKPFDRYVDRVRMLATAVAVLWLIRYCGLWGRFGFDWSRNGTRQFLWAFAAGVIMLGLMLPLQFVFLDLQWQLPRAFPGLLQALLAAVLAASLLSWLEEAIFRGMLLRIFWTAFARWTAILLSAFVFAIVHFKRVPWDRDAEVGLWSGLEVAGMGVFSFIYTFELFHFVNLLLAGILLNLVFLRTRNLAACMGLHAGWVTVRGLWGDWVVVAESPATVWVGSRGVVDGILPIFILLAVIVWLALPPASKPVSVH
ncbi:MAG: CPBP family intramembrane metalloprotease [Opitutales bacterium]|nr:CPBP family intramembrane metalloprotease [Opitutales bacterium]